MSGWICRTCGILYPPSDKPPAHCRICEDARQYVSPEGQQWTTLAELRRHHRNEWRDEEPACRSVHTEPSFAISQRAYLIETPEGNLLWDCLTLIDDNTIDYVRQRGGLRAIAVSHPHYYSTMAEWSEAFGDVPIHIHSADRSWVQRHEQVAFWHGETKPLFGGLTLIRSGGHFDGYQVLHWRDGADGRGGLFAGDQPQVCMDRRWVTFMYSYPNMIPFNEYTVTGICDSLEPWPFDRIYGAFGRNVPQDAKGVIARSQERYLKAIRPEALL